MLHSPGMSCVLQVLVMLLMSNLGKITDYWVWRDNIAQYNLCDMAVNLTQGRSHAHPPAPGVKLQQNILRLGDCMLHFISTSSIMGKQRLTAEKHYN